MINWIQSNCVSIALVKLNRSNPIHGSSWIEFGHRTKSNSHKKNRTKSNFDIRTLDFLSNITSFSRFQLYNSCFSCSRDPLTKFLNLWIISSSRFVYRAIKSSIEFGCRFARLSAIDSEIDTQISVFDLVRSTDCVRLDSISECSIDYAVPNPCVIHCEITVEAGFV